MKMVINNVNVVTADKIIYGGAVEVEGQAISKVSDVALSGEKVIDGEGKYLIPGFIDMHCHGAKGLDFTDCSKEEMKVLEDFYLSNGTTTLVATTLTAKWEILKDSLKTFSEYLKENPNGVLVGIHMEGPWFSPAQSGAQDPSFMKKPNAEELESLIKEYPFVLRVSVAPEIDEDFSFGKKGKELGLVVSAGHTDADFDTVVNASKNGYTLLTHFYSGMKGVTRVNAYRIAGAVEAGYYLDDMNVEIIADGKHLPESLLKLIYKLKGEDRISLITDATRGCGYPDGTKSFIGTKQDPMPIVIKDGVAFTADQQAFAGSTSTFDKIYKTMGKAIGKDFVALSKMSSLNPAKIMNFTDRGEIKEGKLADLLIVNEDLEIEKIIYKGKEIK